MPALPSTDRQRTIIIDCNVAFAFWDALTDILDEKFLGVQVLAEEYDY